MIEAARSMNIPILVLVNKVKIDDLVMKLVQSVVLFEDKHPL